MRGAKRDGGARRRRVRRLGCKTDMCSPPQPATQGTTAVSLPLQMPIDVRSCVHMWVPTAHCPPDPIAERAVESMLPATTAMRTHTQSPPSPRRCARARAIARRGSYIPHCANETDVATQRMSTCRSQCDGDRIHPVWGARTFSASSAACFSATAFLACQTTTSCRNAKPGEGQPPPRFGGGGGGGVQKKVGNLPLAIYGRVERASKFGPCDGAGVQVRGAKRDGDPRWRLACDTWGVKPSVRNRTAGVLHSALVCD